MNIGYETTNIFGTTGVYYAGNAVLKGYTLSARKRGGHFGVWFIALLLVVLFVVVAPLVAGVNSGVGGSEAVGGGGVVAGGGTEVEK